MSGPTIHGFPLEQDDIEVGPIETKEDIVRILETIKGTDLFTYTEIRRALERIIDSDVFKPEDFMFYVNVVNSQPPVEIAGTTNLVVVLTHSYIRSNKLQRKHYDFAFHNAPWWFITSKYFTLEEFNYYYYTDLINVNLYSIEAVRGWMEKRLLNL